MCTAKAETTKHVSFRVTVAVDTFYPLVRDEYKHACIINHN